MTDSTYSDILDIMEDDGEGGASVIHGSVKIDGNLEVATQISTKEFKVFGENGSSVNPTMTARNGLVQFNKVCKFMDTVEFNNGKTTIGTEATYGSACVASDTFMAGERILVGDSLFKITADTRKIIADTFTMTLSKLDTGNLVAKNSKFETITTKNGKVTNEFISESIFANTIKVNKLFLDTVSGLKVCVSESMVAKEFAANNATIQNGLTIRGIGINGAALTVNGGEIVANKGIVSHTRNNRFQCMQIMGSGTDHDTCFKIDRNVDSLIEGDVTIQGSRLILDNSKLISDDIIVAPLETSTETTGVQLTTSSNWEAYKESMVENVEPEDDEEDQYDAVAQVEQAMERNRLNYEAARETVKSLVNPITYQLVHSNPNVPGSIHVKQGIYRIDNSGNALFKNVISEEATFNHLSAYRFNVNKLHVDNLVTTSVASNVVDTDNLLKSRGIAEFDGAVHTSADVFVEDGSKINVASGASMVINSGASLTIRDGASFEMGTNTSVKMAGDIELDLAKLVFVDSSTGRKYKISFRETCGCEGGGIVMDYEKVVEDSSNRTANETMLDARELDKKLKSLGV